MNKHGSLIILSLIMVVNALSYAIIIPLLYPYSSRFGITPVGLSLLFASFSIAQLIATPIMGRLSDRYGRKPLLLISLFGTAVSLAMFAAAKNSAMLFFARITDGITGGNNSVAQAVIADSVKPKERAKYFGILGAAFGFGFLIGPAIGGLMSKISLTAPFWFAAALALAGTVMGIFFLKESLPKEDREKVKNETLFRPSHYIQALFSPTIGIILMLSFLINMGFNAYIIGFQSFTVDVLKLNATQVGMSFALSGLISVVMQALGIRVLLKYIPSKRTILRISLLCTSVILFLTFFTQGFYQFLASMLIFSVFNAPQLPMITALLSERTKEEDQGGALGINQSYISFGQIVGTLAAGAVSILSVRYIFLLSTISILIALYATRFLYIPVKNKTDL